MRWRLSEEPLSSDLRHGRLAADRRPRSRPLRGAQILVFKPKYSHLKRMECTRKRLCNVSVHLLVIR